MSSRQECQFRECKASRFRAGVIASIFMASVACLVAVGCGKSKPSFQEVSGHVMFQRHLLRKGLIEFVPTSPGGSSAGAIIRDGKYTVRTEAGLLPGSYRVKIVPTVPPRADWEATPQGGPQIVIPPKYNSNTTLTAEVKAESPQTIDFALD
jgi:hypothetical protein